GYSGDSGTRVRFRTFGAGPFSFTAAFASCAGGTRLVPISHVSNSGVFAAIAAIDPHVFIHMGDFHYYNLTGAARPLDPLMGRFRRALDRVLSQEQQALLYRRTPIVYMWDDHDYGQNDSDGNSPTRDAARAYYATDVPHYPLPLGDHADGPITQTFDIGRVRFVVTDSRSERKPGERTMLGTAQFKWLIDELGRAASDHVPLLVWVNPVPWITRDGDGDGWGMFAAERRAIGERIATLGIGNRLLMMSGDAHMLAFDDGRNNPHGGFVVAQAAPLDRFLNRKGGPYSHEPPQQKNGQFAVLRVDDTGDVLTATIEGHRHLGNGRSVVVPETRLRMRCTGQRCELQPLE
ncbi:MAG: alkaline phosphatase D family protein, partial [Acidobacteriota bacterium]